MQRANGQDTKGRGVGRGQSAQWGACGVLRLGLPLTCRLAGLCLPCQPSGTSLTLGDEQVACRPSLCTHLHCYRQEVRVTVGSGSCCSPSRPQDALCLPGGAVGFGVSWGGVQGEQPCPGASSPSAVGTGTGQSWPLTACISCLAAPGRPWPW